MRPAAMFAISISGLSSALCGCTAVQSQAANGAMPDGIPYFLPRRPFVITVSTPTGGGPPSISVLPGVSEPDLSKEFVLSQGTNLLAQNEFNITVSKTGLLMTSQSTATSQVATALQNAAASAGMFVAPVSIGGAAQPLAQIVRSQSNALDAALAGEEHDARGFGPEIACPLSGSSLQYVVYPEGRFDSAHPLKFNCADDGSYSVTWERSDHPTPIPQRGYRYGYDSPRLTNGRRESGLFFRHELPYLVVVTGTLSGRPETVSHFIVSSPDESEADFFPVKRNLFANNTANITVTDGVVTGVDQVTQSEVAGLVGLPATFISSYTTAIGQLFSGLGNISSSQQKLLQQQQATAATQNQAAAIAAAQYQTCRKTLASFNFANMSAAEASAATAAIQAACSSSTN